MTQLLTFASFTEAARATRPEVAFILGSGMGLVAQRIADRQAVPFAEVPGLAATSVVGHSGCLTLGTWAGKQVLVFEGRLHFYEGHPWRQVTRPIHTAAFLGARVLVLTNAAGGIHQSLGPGSLMAIRDHLEWTYQHWYRRPGPAGLGRRRASPYSQRLLGVMLSAAESLGMNLHQGIYAAVTGPCYETPAEIRALQAWGADAVGMSTAREVQTGHRLGLECAALSCITNRAAGLGDGPLNHDEVITTAAAQAERLADLLETFLTRL